MGLIRGLKAVNLEMTDIIPQLEMIENDEFLLSDLRIDTRDPDQQYPYGWYKYSQIMGFDFVWNIVEMPMHGRYTNMGHAVWDEQSGYDNNLTNPFKEIEDVLAFDPVEECGMASKAEMVKTFQSKIDEARRICPDVLVPGGRYHTVFSACIRTFGWEMFLISIPHHEEEFNKVLEGFMELSRAEAEAWAETDIDVYIAHDDIVWSNGAAFDPEWYRKYIFPKYKKIWAPLKEKGIKIVFCADGNFNEFIDDIAEAGADGFLFEPVTSLDYIVEKYGKTKIIMGNADCRVLQFGTREDIYNEVKRCTDLGRNCPGFFMLMSNHIPNAIPKENIEYYFEVFEKLRRR